jgi:hypothetical protein
MSVIGLRSGLECAGDSAASQAARAWVRVFVYFGCTTQGQVYSCTFGQTANTLIFVQ